MRNNSYLCTVTAASTPDNRDNAFRRERPIWLTYIQIYTNKDERKDNKTERPYGLS